MAEDWHDLASLEGQLIGGAYRLGEPISDRAARALRLRDRAPAVFERLDLDEALEAEFTSQYEPVEHPGVLMLWDRGILAPGVGYLIRPEPVGPTLDDVLDEGPLELGRALETLEGIVEALKALHQRGIVLENLRPTVIRIVPGWSREQVRIPAGPWGIGPAAGQAYGGYCAPEVGYDESTSIADQFSVGVIAYELLTGTTPHNPEAPPGDRTMLPFLPADGVPDQMEPMIRRLLAEESSGRYPDLGTLADELSRLREELVPDAPDVGHFTPIMPPGRSSIPEVMPRSRPIYIPEEVEEVPMIEPPTDSILGGLLLILSVFGCALGLSYAILMFW